MTVDASEVQMRAWFERREWTFKACNIERKTRPARCDAKIKVQMRVPNLATPDGAVKFLQKLSQGQLLSPASTTLLLGLMTAQTIPHRLRSGVAADVKVADKTGTGGTIGGITDAWNDVAIFTWPNGRTVLVAAFLAHSTIDEDSRNRIFVDIAKALATYESLFK